MGNSLSEEKVTKITFLEFVRDGKLEKVQQMIVDNSAMEISLLTTKDSNKRIPLHISAFYGYPELVNFFIQKMKVHNLKMNKHAPKNKNALLFACMSQEHGAPKAKIVKNLIENGCAVNDFNTVTKMSPLHWACYEDNEETIELLLKAGADYKKKNKEGFNPLDIAGAREKKGNIQVICNFILETSILKENSPLKNTAKDTSSVAPMNSKNKLIIKTKLRNYSEKEKFYLKTLYWAAFFDLKNIVENIIQIGISPFLRYKKKKNAVMAAIQGNSFETLKMINSYSYESLSNKSLTSENMKLRGILSTDKSKNSAFHHACMQNNVEIYDFLMKNAPNVPPTRNHMGWYAEDLSPHIPHQENPPDYLIIATNSCANDIKKDFKEDLGIKIKTYPTLKGHTFLCLYFPEKLFLQKAEDLKLPVRLKFINDIYEFNAKYQDQFMPLMCRHKHYMIQELLADTIDLKKYKKSGAVINHFPLHDEFREQIKQSWNKKCLSIMLGWLIGGYNSMYEPLNFIALYYGERVAWYFTWLTFYTSWLLFPILPGIAISVLQFMDMKIDNKYIAFYCIFMALWVTIFMQMWWRKQNQLAFRWDVRTHKRKDAEREDFAGELTFDNHTMDVTEKSYSNSYVRGVFFSLPMIIFGIALLVAIFIGCRIWSSVNSSFELSIAIGAVNAVAIVILDVVYKKLAIMIVNMENHKYLEEWENSYIVKSFSLQFVNSYISLFAIAFYDQDLTQLAYSLGSIFVAKQFLMNFLELLFPLVKFKWFLKKLTKKWETNPSNITDPTDNAAAFELEKNLLMSETKPMYAQYSEMVIQLGYIVMFAPAFPLACLFAFLNNLWEIKGEISDLSFIQKRGIAEGSSGIGAWAYILEIIGLIATIVNCMMLYFTSEETAVFFDEYLNIDVTLDDFADTAHVFYIIIAVEHVIIAIKIFISAIIKDVPFNVSNMEAHRNKTHFEIPKKLKEYNRLHGGNEDLDASSIIMPQSKQTIVKSKSKLSTPKTILEDIEGLPENK